MAYFPVVIPYPGTLGAPFFDGQNITHFLDLYSQLCADYHLSESQKIYCLPWYCKSFIRNYIKILIKGADWAAVRAILRRKYKENDLNQLMYSRQFLKALKKKARSKDNNLMHYCQPFASISRDLVSRKRLDRYTQCQWFLQGLPETVLTEIFYCYNINLEDDNDINFDNLLEKTLMFIRRRKWLADFIKENKSDWRFTSHPKDQSTAEVNHHSKPSVVLLPACTAPNTVEFFILSVQDLAPPIQFYTMQATVQENVPVVRIHESRVKEVKADKEKLGDNDGVFVLDPKEDYYNDFKALFAKPADEDLKQPSVSYVGPFKHVKDKRIGTRSLDIKGKKVVQGLGLQVPKKEGICTEKRRYLGPGCLVIERPMQKVMKSKDHG